MYDFIQRHELKPFFDEMAELKETVRRLTTEGEIIKLKDAEKIIPFSRPEIVALIKKGIIPGEQRGKGCDWLVRRSACHEFAESLVPKQASKKP